METSSLAGWAHASGARSIGSLLLLILAIVTSSAPAAQSSMDQFMAKRGYTAVDVRYGFRNHLTTAAKINGRSANCWVDTGAMGLVLDTRRTGGLKVTGRTAASGLFGEYSTNLPTVSVDRFQLGSVLFSNQAALISSLHRNLSAPIGSYIPQASAGEEPDAIVGISTLKNMHAWIDYNAPRMYVCVEAPAPSVLDAIDRTFRASGYAMASARLLGDRLFAEALINDRPALFQIDTGMFDSMIALDKLSAYNLSNQELLGHTIDASGRNKGDLKYTRPDSLKIASFELKQYPIGTLNMPILAQEDEELKKENLPPLVGLVGPDILIKSRALIDCSRGRMYVMPEKPPQ